MPRLLLAAARKLALIFGGVAVGTVVVSLLLGLLTGSRAARAISVGFYSVGSLLLVGCVVMGSRGALRGELRSESGGFLQPRSIRRATLDEHLAARHLSLGLFAFGMAFIALGAVFDPNRALV